jgi:hypothetical protein
VTAALASSKGRRIAPCSRPIVTWLTPYDRAISVCASPAERRRSASCSFGLAAAQAVRMAIKTTFGSDEGEARCHAPELDLVLEVVGP